MDTYNNIIFRTLAENLETTDEEFDQIYPEELRALSALHWTPVHIAKLAAEFLAPNANCKVLDIGSGVGKFCFVGAAVTKGSFHGVEQRSSFVTVCNALAAQYEIPNVSFKNENITNIAFDAFDAFYFFNPFYENVEQTLIIDDTVQRKEGLFLAYSDYVYQQLDQSKIGTRLVTYHSIWDDVPNGFQLEYRSLNGDLSFWTKTEGQ